MSLKVKFTSDSSVLPYRAYNSAGFDLFAAINASIEPNDRFCIPTGIICEFPVETYGRIAGRSSLAANYGIIIGGGVIDPDFRGEIKVIVINTGRETFEIKTGDRIAQLICEKYSHCRVKKVANLLNTTRSESGFGSSGI